MSNAYLCTTCRLRLVLRKYSPAIYRQRQWLSQTKRQAQDPIERVFAGKPRYSGSATDDRSTHSRDDVSRGRYSGQPLAPQYVLDELGKPAPTSHALGSSSSKPKAECLRDIGDAEFIPPSRRSKRYDVANSKHPAIPPDLWRQYQLFCRDTTPLHHTDADDLRAIETLKAIAQTYANSDGLRQLDKEGDLRKRGFWLMTRTTHKWTKDITSDQISAQGRADPVEVMALVMTCCNPTNNIFPKVLWHVATALVRLRAEVGQASQQKLVEGIETLMGLWNICMQSVSPRSRNIARNKLITKDWSFLPDQTLFAETLQSKRRRGGLTRFSLERALNLCLPFVVVTAEQAKTLASEGSDLYDYPSAALVTLDLLHGLNSERAGGRAVEEFIPWMRLMDTAFKNAGDYRIPFALGQKSRNYEQQEYYRGVIERFGLSDKRVEPISEMQRSGGSADEPDNTDGITVTVGAEDLPRGLSSTANEKQEPVIDMKSNVYSFSNTCVSRLGRAVEQQDLTAALRIHGDIEEFLSRNPDSQFPIKLYEHLLYSFLALRHPKLTASIWKNMINAGHQPSGQTYTVMMRGCQQVRDHKAMEGFWNKMRQTGIKPDRYAWTTRIFGLLSSPLHPDVGMKALVEMGQEWVTAARAACSKEGPSSRDKKGKGAVQSEPWQLMSTFEGDVNGVARPDVTVMNSAISALAAKNDFRIPKALSWGRSFGIEPDLTTYNVLINISMRQGLPDEAMTILQRMREKGIEVDSNTWTVLLSAMFEGPLMRGLEGEQVAERVLGFVRNIDEMQGKGLDEKGYALLVDRLLKVHNHPSAAQKVLDHMAAKGMEPNAYLYTILMSSYFQQSPPNFAAVESLWARIQSENAGYGAALDSTFYDRMIEAYALHHDTVGTKTMLSFLTRMESQGKKPSWRALEHAARALAEAGEWERLAQIIEQARRERHENRDADRGSDQRRFWRFVSSIELGVADDMGVPKEVPGILPAGGFRSNFGADTD